MLHRSPFVAKKKKTTTRSSTASKTAKKRSGAKKPTSTKAAAKKVAKKPTKKKASSKKVAKKKPTKKVVKKKTTKKATTKKKTTKKKSTTQNAGAKKPTKQKAPAKPVPAEMTLEQAMDQDWTPAKLRRVKTGLKKKDLQYFLNLLLEKRAEIVGNIKGMELTRSGALSDIAHMPLHMADVGSDNFEQEFTLGLMESERKILKDINDALMRMKDGIYGVCLDSGRPINRARLEVKPWAKYCIEVARLREKRGW